MTRLTLENQITETIGRINSTDTNADMVELYQEDLVFLEYRLEIGDYEIKEQ